MSTSGFECIYMLLCVVHFQCPGRLGWVSVTHGDMPGICQASRKPANGARVMWRENPHKCYREGAQSAGVDGRPSPSSCIDWRVSSRRLSKRCLWAFHD